MMVLTTPQNGKLIFGNSDFYDKLNLWQNEEYMLIIECLLSAPGFSVPKLFCSEFCSDLNS